MTSTADPMTPVMIAAPLAHVDGQALSIRDPADLLAKVDAAFMRGQGFTLFTLNLDHLVKRRRDANFRALYACATFVTADGWPVVLLGRREAPALVRTTGADLVVPLCGLAAQRGVPVALVGSTATTLEVAATRLRALCPGLDIVTCDAPSYGFDPRSAAGDAAIARLATSGARLVLLALGAPKQETFADRALSRCPGVGFVCIGAALDFIAGAQRRAPLPLQRLRLEWAWRLALQPRRLGLRYLSCLLLFARLLMERAPPPLTRRDKS